MTQTRCIATSVATHDGEILTLGRTSGTSAIWMDTRASFRMGGRRSSDIARRTRRRSGQRARQRIPRRSRGGRGQPPAVVSLSGLPRSARKTPVGRTRGIVASLRDLNDMAIPQDLVGRCLAVASAWGWPVTASMNGSRSSVSRRTSSAAVTVAVRRTSRSSAISATDHGACGGLPLPLRRSSDSSLDAVLTHTACESGVYEIEVGCLDPLSAAHQLEVLPR